MKISARPGKKRIVYGWLDNGLWFISPLGAGVPQRPMNRYDTREDAEAEAMARNCVIEWENVLDG